MVRFTLVLGAVLVVLGVGAYVLTAAASPTALIPALVGLLLLACGALARSPQRRRPALIASLVIALLAALGSLMNVARIGDVLAGTAERPAAVVVSTVMFVLLVAHLVVVGRGLLAGRSAAGTSG